LFCGKCSQGEKEFTTDAGVERMRVCGGCE
jgi:hypothetical protein